MRKLINILCLLISSTSLFAQTENLEIQVSVERLEISSRKSFGDKSTDAVFKFYQDSATVQNSLQRACIHIESKKTEAVVTAEDSVLRPVHLLQPFSFPVAGDTVRIAMETYENDKGERCDYDKGDDYYSIAYLAVPFGSLNPGVFSQPFTIASRNEKFVAVIRLRYTIPAPVPIALNYADPICAASQSLRISSGTSLLNRNGLACAWECRTDGNDTGWALLQRLNPEDTLALTPLKDIFKTELRRNTVMQLRVKIESPELHSLYTAPVQLELTPDPPAVDLTDVSAVPTCYEEPTGNVLVRKVNTAMDSVWYRLLPRTDADLLLATGEIPNNAIRKQGHTAAGSFVSIDSLPEGAYTLVMANSGVKAGKILTAVPFSISRYPKLVISSHMLEEASCDTVRDGVIKIETSGGNPGKLMFAIAPASGTMVQEGRNAVFSGLRPGSYTIFVKDECGQSASISDLRLHKRTSKAAPMIAVEDNGALQITLQHAGNTEYHCTLYKGGRAEAEAEFEGDSYQISNLDPGQYTIKLWDTAFGICPIWDSAFSIDKVSVAEQLPMPVIRPADTMDRIAALDYNNPTLLNYDSASIASATEAGLDREHIFYNASIRKSIAYAPAKIAKPTRNDYFILVEKSKYMLHVYRTADSQLLVSYPVVFGNDDLEDKMYEGDRETPEGEFTISVKKTHKEWNKYLGIDYPTKESQRRFKERKTKGALPPGATIGGGVGLHGTVTTDNISVDARQNWTWGCVATKNQYIDELYDMIPLGTKVIIVR